MISRANSCFQQNSQGLQMYNAMEDMLSSSAAVDTSSSTETHSNVLLYNLSILRDKVQQVQSFVDVIVSSDQAQHESIAVAVAGTGTIVQEIIVTASSMMYTCQQMALVMAQNNEGELNQHHNKTSGDGSSLRSHDEIDSVFQIGEESGRGYYSGETLHLYHNNLGNNNNNATNEEEALCRDVEKNDGFAGFQPMSCDIIELDAAELLAKFTHYCQVCGKGFKRDANLRMHMRAHGDEYKSNAALSNPLKKSNRNSIGIKDYYPLINSPRKYSCPHEGCRWNKKHAKFQPLKSMVCVKNHYKRSHCPKMYVCNRCNRKQFSVLSDLRTHEKHCGDAKWQCSCGTTFSRKDKLMGHVTLFIGHSPADHCYVKQAKPSRGTVGIQLDKR